MKVDDLMGTKQDGSPNPAPSHSASRGKRCPTDAAAFPSRSV
ncbi:hypothetical protein SLEP1_g24932 [Rubroshorea leprosula]|uniref:Uncharacterized protein n=1 Tax=Rubroshorea leprosula TaxID=152421 RepID=A0AAV5JUJ7_9ROSI|nr:hypothetical protein SLEP1_g24932 [Rubroshorea leprosula]